MVISTHRSQHKNKELALGILRAKLFARHQDQQRQILRATRARAAETDVTTRERYVRTYDPRTAEYSGLMAGDLKSMFEKRQRQNLMRQIAAQVDGSAR